MKKQLFIIFSLIISLFSFKNVNCQNEDIKLPIDSITGEILFINVVKLDSISKDELFSRALSWYAKYYKSSKSVIQSEDRIGGVIIAKPLFKVYTVGLFGEEIAPGHDVNYTVSVFVKDGKYKVEVTNFILNNTSKIPASGKGEYLTLNFCNRARKKCYDEATAIIESLKQDMEISKSKSDW
jgi:hypothetical protein